MPSYSFSHHNSKKTWTSVQKITGHVTEFSVIGCLENNNKNTQHLYAQVELLEKLTGRNLYKKETLSRKEAITPGGMWSYKKQK